MAYYSGQATSYQELLDVLVASCVAEGWTWADGILNKNNLFILPYISTSLTTHKGPGLIIQGGTGKTGSSLVEPSLVEPRMGAIGGAVTKSKNVVFPCNYNIHIFTEEKITEVYFIVKFDVDKFYYLAFGEAVFSGGFGLWLTGSVPKYYNTSNSGGDQGWSISQTGGGSNSYSYYSGPFWSNEYRGGNKNTDAIYLKGNESKWLEVSGTLQTLDAINASVYKAPLIARQPSVFSSESIFIPIDIFITAASSKCSLAISLNNSKYLRINNYEPEQIITLGHEKWKIYPFYRKSLLLPNGGNDMTHTGTFGWAIRYDGP